MMFPPILALVAVVALSTPGTALAQDLLVGYWTFDSDEGARAVDLSGYGNHGVFVGPVTEDDGVVGSGISLIGGGERIEVPPSSSLDDLEAFTIAAWVKTVDDSNQAIVAKDDRNILLKIGAFKEYIKGCVRVGTIVCSVSLYNVVPTGQWTFVAMTYDSRADRQVHLYIDGEEVGYRSQPAAREGRDRSSDAGAPLAIGAIPGSGRQAFNGQIDEVRLFATALSSARIRDLLEGDLGAPGTDTVAPLVTITDPAGDFVQTQAARLDLTGVAVDSSEIVDVVWSTDQGDFGYADGGASWEAADVPLSPGENVISVTARDVAGNAGSASLRAYQLDDTPTIFEGYGAVTTGGAGYPTFVAASPEDLVTLLDAVSARGGNATIRLSGRWEYGSTVRLANMKNLTLDGTGADVTFRDTSLIVQCSENVILQGLRVRKNQAGGDGIQINSSEHVVIDHNSVSAAGDGNIDITGWSCGPSRYITVSWNIFADTWKQCLVKYGGTTQVSFHHNLFYNSGNRIPALQSEGDFDVRNNVFWQWGSSGTSLQFGARANLIGNVYTAGTADRGHAAIWYQDELSKAWIADNLVPPTESDVSRLGGPISVPVTTTHSAEVAKSLVVDGAGAWPRDSYDADVAAAVADGVFPVLPPFHD